MSRSDDPSMPDDGALCGLFRDLALQAGREIMAVFDSAMTVETKSDATPVTEADRRAEAVILAGLRAAVPGISCVAEEEYAAGCAREPSGDAFILVDPLDGTREFISHRTDFTVNIALVRGGAPVAGVVFAPARGVVYWGDRAVPPCARSPGASCRRRARSACAAGRIAPWWSPADRIARRRRMPSSRVSAKRRPWRSDPR